MRTRESSRDCRVQKGSQMSSGRSSDTLATHAAGDERAALDHSQRSSHAKAPLGRGSPIFRGAATVTYNIVLPGNCYSCRSASIGASREAVRAG